MIAPTASMNPTVVTTGPEFGLDLGPAGVRPACSSAFSSRLLAHSDLPEVGSAAMVMARDGRAHPARGVTRCSRPSRRDRQRPSRVRRRWSRGFRSLPAWPCREPARRRHIAVWWSQVLLFRVAKTILGAMTSSSLAAVAHDAVGPPIPFDNSYARLPEAFYERVRPLRVAAPQLLRLNEALAQKLRIDTEFLQSSQGVEILAGNAIAPGSEPIALAYAGHQFGHFVPQLG